MRRYELTDEQWKLIEHLLPGKEGDPGAHGEDNRRFVNGVIWIARTSAPWRDLPERYGEWNSVYQQFNRWSKSGVWNRVFQAVATIEACERRLPVSTMTAPTERKSGVQAGSA